MSIQLNRNLLLIIFLILFVGLAFINWGCEKDPPTASELFSVSIDTLNYEPVFLGQHKDISFTIINIGRSNIKRNLSLDNDNFSIINPNNPIHLNPGDSVVITIRFESHQSDTMTCQIFIDGTVDPIVTCNAISNSPTSYKWNKMTSGTNYWLYGVWGTAADNVYAVGGDCVNNECSGVILNYNGEEWETVCHADGYLYEIWGTSEENIFAIGGGGIIIHYDGQTWTPVDSFTKSGLRGIHGFGSDDIFVVGTLGGLFNFYGSTWNRLPCGGGICGGPYYSVWGADHNNVYASGMSGQITKFDGSIWSLMTTPVGSYVSGIYGLNHDNIYAVGHNPTVILQFDGQQWNSIFDEGSDYLNDIWLDSPDNIFVSGGKGLIMHYDGNSWSKSYNNGDSEHISSIWGYSKYNIFAVGRFGNIIHYEPEIPPE